MQRAVVSFYQDEEGHWAARLECGHGQHVRHDPPWTVREWVLTEEGRADHRPLPANPGEKPRSRRTPSVLSSLD